MRERGKIEHTQKNEHEAIAERRMKEKNKNKN